MAEDQHHPANETPKPGRKSPALRRALIFGLEGLVTGALIGLLTTLTIPAFLGVCLLGMVGGAFFGVLLFRSE